MNRVEFTRAGNHDLMETVNWYETQVPSLGTRFFEDFDRVVSRIEVSPDQFPKIYRQAHRALLSHFPFGVFFRRFEGRTLVVAVIDLRREARRWQARI